MGEYHQKGTKATKYGTKEEYVECVKKCKQNGIVVYIDAVLNHRLGADGTETFGAVQVDENDRLKDISDVHDIDGWTSFKFPGRTESCPSSLRELHYYHFTGVDYDAKTETKGIFRIQGDGKYWAKDTDKEKGSCAHLCNQRASRQSDIAITDDFLMGADIDHDHPEIRDDIFHWGDWIIKETGAAGFRFVLLRLLS